MSKSLLEAFRKKQSSLLPKGSEVRQFELVEGQGLLGVEYGLDEMLWKQWFSAETSEGIWQFSKKSLYKEGESRDWELVEGNEVKVLSDRQVVKADSEVSSVQPISKDMRLYENPHLNFSTQYPKNWYYMSFGAQDGKLWLVGFADKALESKEDAVLTLSVESGSGVGKKTQKGDSYRVEVARDSKSHFVLGGPLLYKDTLDRMAEALAQE